MWNLKRNDINELINKTKTDSHLENKLMVAGRRGKIRGKGKFSSLGSTCTHCYT